MEVITLTPEETTRWEKQCEPITESWIKDMESKGYPGGKFVEAAKRHIKKHPMTIGSWQD